MEKNLVELFHFHFLGGVRYWEERQEVVHFYQPCRKTLEGHALRFKNCVPHRTILFGDHIDRE